MVQETVRVVRLTTGYGPTWRMVRPGRDVRKIRDLEQTRTILSNDRGWFSDEGLSNALMHRSKDKYLLQCPGCGCRAFVIQGPLIETGVVQCANCQGEIGPVEEFLAAAEARIERAEQERWKRRFH